MAPRKNRRRFTHTHVHTPIVKEKKKPKRETEEGRHRRQREREERGAEDDGLQTGEWELSKRGVKDTTGKSCGTLCREIIVPLDSVWLSDRFCAADRICDLVNKFSTARQNCYERSSNLVFFI